VGTFHRLQKRASRFGHSRERAVGLGAAAERVGGGHHPVLGARPPCLPSRHRGLHGGSAISGPGGYGGAGGSGGRRSFPFGDFLLLFPDPSRGCSRGQRYCLGGGLGAKRELSWPAAGGKAGRGNVRASITGTGKKHDAGRAAGPRAGPTKTAARTGGLWGKAGPDSAARPGVGIPWGKMLAELMDDFPNLAAGPGGPAQEHRPGGSANGVSRSSGALLGRGRLPWTGSPSRRVNRAFHRGRFPGTRTPIAASLHRLSNEVDPRRRRGGPTNPAARSNRPWAGGAGSPPRGPLVATRLRPIPEDVQRKRIGLRAASATRGPLRGAAPPNIPLRHPGRHPTPVILGKNRSRGARGPTL